MEAKSELVEGPLWFNAPNYRLSLVLAAVVEGDAVNCSTDLGESPEALKFSLFLDMYPRM